MSETSAAALLGTPTGEAVLEDAGAEKHTSPLIDSDELEEDELETEETEETEDEPEQEELPDAVKEILKKNRKEVREANARAVAAERALAAKDSGEAPAEPANDKFKDLFVQSAAKSALKDAGLSEGTDRFVKLLDLSSVTVDEDGTVSGLEDQIADLKEDFKDLFAPKAPRKTTVRGDAAGRRETVVIPKTSADRLASKLFN